MGLDHSEYSVNVSNYSAVFLKLFKAGFILVLYT